MVIILIGEVNVQNKRELTKIENEYIQKELNNVLCMNTFGAYHTEEEKINYHTKYYAETDQVSESKIKFTEEPMT